MTDGKDSTTSAAPEGSAPARAGLVLQLDDRSRERRADDVVVHRRESHTSDGRDRRRVGGSGRSNHQLR